MFSLLANMLVRRNGREKALVNGYIQRRFKCLPVKMDKKQKKIKNPQTKGLDLGIEPPPGELHPPLDAPYRRIYPCMLPAAGEAGSSLHARAAVGSASIGEGEEGAVAGSGLPAGAAAETGLPRCRCRRIHAAVGGPRHRGGPAPPPGAPLLPLHGCAAGSPTHRWRPCCRRGGRGRHLFVVASSLGEVRRSQPAAPKRGRHAMRLIGRRTTRGESGAMLRRREGRRVREERGTPRRG
jgi:hypothetical protein